MQKLLHSINQKKFKKNSDSNQLRHGAQLMVSAQ